MVAFIAEVQKAYYKETGISDYRRIPEEFWEKKLTQMGL